MAILSKNFSELVGLVRIPKIEPLTYSTVESKDDSLASNFLYSSS